MSTRSRVFLIALLVLLGASSFYVVDESEQVVVTLFGKPVGTAVTTPGLKLKLPLVHELHRFDKRFLEWDGEANQVPTRDKRFVWVDTYARWRITDPLLYYQRLKDERGAQTRLDDILDGETRSAIAKHELAEVVRTTSRQPVADQSLTTDERIVLDPITVGREGLRKEILEASQPRVVDLGIELLDVQIKRTNYIQEDRVKVFDRMISERKRIATRYRSEGEGEASRIRGEMQRELQRIRSEAYRTAQEIQGRADAEATGIYAEVYDQNAESRSLYQFLKALETLKTASDGETTLLLSTEGDALRYLKGDGR